MRSLIAIALTLFTLSGEARDPAQVRAFRKDHPCPLTGKTTGPCTDGKQRMVVDHMLPICSGGRDAPDNMAWQEYSASLVKDAEERRLCARLKQCKP